MNVVIHIGLHKTASGTLQRQFFPMCSGVNLLTTLDERVRRFILDVTRTDPAYFDPERAARSAASFLDETQVNLISNESLSGPPYAGVIETGLDHRSPVIENLKRVFPEARIILVLRRQDSLARSLYRQYIKRGGTESAKRFYGGDEERGIIRLDRFLYSRYVDLVRTAFPQGLQIQLFEDFVTNRHDFLAKLCEYIGTPTLDTELVPENASTVGPIGMQISRYSNRFFQSMLNNGPLPRIPRKQYGRWIAVSPVEYLHDFWPGKGRPSSTVSEICTRILDEVKDDNRRVDEEYRLGMPEHGYY